MAIEIAGAPEPIRSPRFAGVTLRVPLSEEPPAAWLDVLVTHASLPGKGHRVDGAALELHLGQGDRDVAKALRRLDETVQGTNAKYDADRELLEQRARGPAAQVEAAITKITPICEDWWAAKCRASETDAIAELGPGAPAEPGAR